MGTISNYLIIRKLRSNVDAVVYKVDPSYKLSFTSVSSELKDRVEQYLSKKQNWSRIVEDYKEGEEYPRKYLTILMYYILTYETGGTEYGHMGHLSGKGQDAVQIAAKLSKQLVEYGYFKDDKEAEEDWKDFVDKFKQKN